MSDDWNHTNHHVAAHFFTLSRHSPFPLGQDGDGTAIEKRGPHPRPREKELSGDKERKEMLLSPPPRTPEPWNRGTEVEEK